jgi:alcohol dehydrogenase, propanol-preferring
MAISEGVVRAMLLTSAGRPLLEGRDIASPIPDDGQVSVSVQACGVCRTDLHIVDGDLANPKLPLVPGHEIVGTVKAVGNNVSGLAVGDRVGIPWLGFTCGNCPYCANAQENLCEQARFTGYTIDGGYADEVVADARY